MNDYLQEKFPDMTPMSSAPTMSTINGIGCTVYGERDFDAETSTYVKTLCFCVLFVPLVFLKAYRVANAPEGGWYFLGRVPMSLLAKMWNVLVVVGVAAAIGLGFWIHHTGQPDYQAKRKLAQGDELAAAGKLGDAADLYRTVALGQHHSATALQKMGELLDGSAAQSQPEEAVRVLVVAMDLDKAGRKVDRLFDRALALSKKFADSDPGMALKLINPVVPIAPRPEEVAKYRLPLIEKALAKDPNNLDLISELALVLVIQRDFAGCEKLLTPHAQRLGTREGARILGQIFASQGKFDEALPLLAPYAEERLKQYTAADQNWQTALKQVDDESIELLKSGKAPGFDFARYKQVDKDTQQRMVIEFQDNRLKDNPKIKRAQADLHKENRVVEVALDLGEIYLRRAQRIGDPLGRRQELEKAEKMFLAVRNAAGTKEEYRLNLGQVYYVLGKPKEGRNLFDEYLKDQKRTPLALYKAGMSFRQVGMETEARNLIKEAYDTEGDPQKKYAFAQSRSAMAIDLDEQIYWLERSDQADGATKASLSGARGMKAMHNGKDQEAAREFRLAIDQYKSLKETTSTLNNSALVYMDLYKVTGEPEAFDHAVANLEKALSLKRDDTILLHNTADQILAKVLGDIVGKPNRIDLRLLREAGSYNHIQFLYQSKAEREQLLAEFRNHPRLAKVREYYERVQLLAPTKASAFASLSGLYAYTQELDKVRALAKRLEETTLDQADYTRMMLEAFQGKKDDKRRKELTAGLTRLELELTEARKLGGPTFGVAAMNWFAAQTRLDFYGTPANANNLVALAEEAFKAAPSQGTAQLVNSALLFRAHKTLLKQEPAYAVLANQCKRSLGSDHVIAFALFRDGPAQKACLANADIQRVLTMLKDETELFLDRSSEWNWAMLHQVHPQEGAKVADFLLKNERSRLNRLIGERIAPLSADMAVRQFWALHLAGQPNEADALLQQAANRGVPLPIAAKK